MTDIDAITSKIRQLPEPLVKEVEDFVDFLHEKHGNAPDNTEMSVAHPAMSAFGLWRDSSELDDLIERIYENRQTQSSRPKVSL
jgi:hypothetical protein